MKIGVMVGKKPNGSYEYVGQPGDVEPLIAAQRDETSKKNYVKTWVGNIASRPLKAKKCAGVSVSPRGKGKGKSAKSADGSE